MANQQAQAGTRGGQARAMMDLYTIAGLVGISLVAGLVGMRVVKDERVLRRKRMLAEKY
ncbi:MAG: hypothetical protein ACREAQ_08125 [Nitrososphaera sp.]